MTLKPLGNIFLCIKYQLAHVVEIQIFWKGHKILSGRSFSNFLAFSEYPNFIKYKQKNPAKSNSCFDPKTAKQLVFSNCSFAHGQEKWVCNFLYQPLMLSKNIGFKINEISYCALWRIQGRKLRIRDALFGETTHRWPE